MHISYEQIAAVMGEEATERVALLAHEAEQIGLRFALVGGVVRDVLLNMPTTDYDFLVDGGELGLGAAAELASAVKDRYDGVVKGHAVVPARASARRARAAASGRVPPRGWTVCASPRRASFRSARSPCVSEFRRRPLVKHAPPASHTFLPFRAGENAVHGVGGGGRRNGSR